MTTDQSSSDMPQEGRLNQDPYRLSEKEKQEISEIKGKDIFFKQVRTSFYPIYGALFREDSATVKRLRRQLRKAGISKKPKDYIASAMAIGAFAGFLLSIIGAAAGYLIVQYSVISLGIFSQGSVIALFAGITTAAIFGGIFGLLISVIAAIYYPQYKAKRRRKKIEQELPEVVIYMYSQAAGGMSGLDIFRDVASSGVVNDELTREFKKIVREVDLFNVSQREALQKASKESPSPEFSDFISQLTTTIVSGGDLSTFLDDKQDYYMAKREENLESELELIDSVSRIYIPISILPILMIVAIVASGFQNNGLIGYLPVIVYFAVPVIGLFFIVLMSTVTRDDLSKRGVVASDENDTGDDSFVDLFSTSKIDSRVDEAEEAVGDLELMRKNIYRRRVGQEVLRQIRETPASSLAVTVPTALVLTGVFFVTGIIDYTPGGFVQTPLKSTVLGVLLPAMIVTLPLAIFYEWSRIRSRAILDPLSNILGEMKQTNEAGKQLLQSVEDVAFRNETLLADELEEVPQQVRFGSDLQTELARVANKYQEPRLSRTVRLITRAREASANISDVLSTAEALSRQEDELERRRHQQATTRIAIIFSAFVILLGVLIVIKIAFLGRVSNVKEAASQTDVFGSFNVGYISVMLFHVTLIQATVTAGVAGSLKFGKARYGLKYLFILIPLSVALWGITFVFF